MGRIPGQGGSPSRCPASPGLKLLSQRRVDQVVDVAPEHIWVHPRKILAATNEFGRAGAGSRQGAQLGHRRTVASDDDVFAALNAAQNISPVVPKIAHRHLVHMASVSPVRPDALT